MTIWSLGKPEPEIEVPLPDNTTRYADLSFVGKQGKVVAAGSGTPGGDIVVVDVRSGVARHQQGQLPPIFGAAVNPAGTLLAVGGMLRGVRFLRLPDLSDAGELPASGNASNPIPS